MDEFQERIEYALQWAKPKSIGSVWSCRLGVWGLIGTTGALLVHRYTECPWGFIGFALGLISLAVIGRLPIGTTERQRKRLALVQTLMLLLITWSPVVWFAGFSGRMSKSELQAMVPGGEPAGAMLTPDGEIVERHTFRTSEEALGEYVGKPIGIAILLGPFFAVSIFLMKRLAIIWYGEAPLVILACVLSIGITVGGYLSIFGLFALAANKPIVPGSTVLVIVVCTGVLYGLRWLVDPSNLDEILS